MEYLNSSYVKIMPLVTVGSLGQFLLLIRIPYSMFL